MSIHEIKVLSKQNDNSPQIIYRFEGITPDQAELLRLMLLTDPVTQDSILDSSLVSDGVVEIGYKPGVTDPQGETLLHAASLLGINPVAVSTSRLVPEHSHELSQIETIITSTPDTILVQETQLACQVIPVTSLTETQLMELSSKHSLFLNLDEMKVIQTYYQKIQREPTDLELETYAQTWSEHCAHKTFKAMLVDENGDQKEPLFDRIKTTSRRYFHSSQVVTAFSDNAGGFAFYDGQVIIAKGETHNSPVAIEPYAGSLTKNGGLYRDIAGCGQGGQNILSLMVNNFAPPDTDPDSVYQGSIHPKVLQSENSRGERNYGNPIGIPTHGIDIHYHPDFGPKPTSLGIAIGIIPESRVEKGRPQPGDLIVTVGGKTGRDGIHGATFSSAEMTGDTKNVHSTAVQLGDPIIEKTTFDALIAARDKNLIRAITDCGAGGYSSAVGEMAGGIGAVVWLEKIPQKYKGLSSWEKWLSESQERMVVAVAKKDYEHFKKICTIFETGCDVIGNFTGDNMLDIFDNGNSVGEIDLDFLHGGLPQRVMQMTKTEQDKSLPAFEIPSDIGEVWEKVISHFNLCSKEKMHRMYDQTVQASTVLAPYIGVNQDIPSQGSVVAPIHGKPYGVVTASAVNPILNRINPYKGSLWAFAHAATKFAAAGGDVTKAAGIDNFIWPFPDSESLGSLDQSVDALCDGMDLFHIPMVSGKDSLSSTYRGKDGVVIKAPPSLNITLFGKIPDIEKTCSPDIKKVGSDIYLVGTPDLINLGGSIYFDVAGIKGGEVPSIDSKNLPEILRVVKTGIDSGKIKSANAIGEGGIAHALSLMCFGGDCGVDVDMSGLDTNRIDFALFSESAGCLLVEVDTDTNISDIFGGVPHTHLGKTKSDKSIIVKSNDQIIANLNTDQLKKAWKQPLEPYI